MEAANNPPKVTGPLVESRESGAVCLAQSPRPAPHPVRGRPPAPTANLSAY